MGALTKTHSVWTEEGSVRPVRLAKGISKKRPTLNREGVGQLSDIGAEEGKTRPGEKRHRA